MMLHYFEIIIVVPLSNNVYSFYVLKNESSDEENDLKVNQHNQF